jgi:hypothetical protein
MVVWLRRLLVGSIVDIVKVVDARVFWWTCVIIVLFDWRREHRNIIGSGHGPYQRMAKVTNKQIVEQTWNAKNTKGL